MISGLFVFGYWQITVEVVCLERPSLDRTKGVGLLGNVSCYFTKSEKSVTLFLIGAIELEIF